MTLLMASPSRSVSPSSINAAEQIRNKVARRLSAILDREVASRGVIFDKLLSTCSRQAIESNELCEFLKFALVAEKLIYLNGR